MHESKFRNWFQFLGGLRGNRIEWPQLLRKLFDEEVERVRRDGVPYVGDVFLDRDEKCLEHEKHPKQHLERVLVQRLYREVHRHHGGVLVVGGEPVWLISFEVPNQAAAPKCRADLLGLKRDGSLVVFECKPLDGGASPLHALLEGLDYLSHLLIPANVERLKSGLARWRAKRRDESVVSRVPAEFLFVEIDPAARHEVIVLAPPEYFRLHWTDPKKTVEGWHMLADRFWPDLPTKTGVELAITDYTSSVCPLFEPAGGCVP